MVVNKYGERLYRGLVDTETAHLRKVPPLPPLLQLPDRRSNQPALPGPAGSSPSAWSAAAVALLPAVPCTHTFTTPRARVPAPLLSSCRRWRRG